MSPQKAEDGDLPDYQSLKAQFARARRAQAEDVVASEQTRFKPVEKIEDPRKIAFRASHVLHVAFFAWMM